MSTGPALRVVREAQGLTLRQVASKAGTTHGYLSQVERGERVPSARWLQAVVDALADNLRRAAYASPVIITSRARAQRVVRNAFELGRDSAIG